MFNCRGVLPFLALVALTTAGCGGDTSLPSEQQGLGEEIKALGGLYFIDKKTPEQGIYSINLKGTKADDAMVAKLEQVKGLKYLDLNGASVTNNAAAALKKLKSLERLDIANTKITAEGLESIRGGLPNVEITWNVAEEPPVDTGVNPVTTE